MVTEFINAVENPSGYKRSLSIIIPVINEAGTIEGTIQELYDKCLNRLPDFELILLEDGSSDNTAEVLHACAKKFPNLIADTNPNRIGFQQQLKRGFAMARKEWVLLMDGDGQIEPSDIWTLLAVPETYDIVTAIKFPRCDPFIRIFISRFFDVLTDLILGISVRDINFGFKLMRTSIARDISSTCGLLGVIFTAEMVIRAVYQGCRIHQVRVHHRKRIAGPSQGIPPMKVLSSSFRAFRGLIKLKKELASAPVSR